MNEKDLIEVLHHVIDNRLITDRDLCERFIKACENVGDNENYLIFLESALDISFNYPEKMRLCCDLVKVARREKYIASKSGYPLVEYSVFNAIFSNSKGCSLDGVNIKDKFLYIIEFSNKSVKIGIANNFDRRKTQIQSASGLTALRWYVTPKINSVQKLENKLHKKYKNQRLKGEFFDIDFDEAVTTLKKCLKKLQAYLK